MEKPEFTKGPWRYDGQSYIWGPNGEMVGMVRGTGEGLPEDANGRMLAAAPRLYEALKLYVEHFGDPLKVARAALAKVEVVEREG